jgi:reactive intermediate/imine deaminase
MMEKSILKSPKVASPRPGQIMSQGVKVTGGTTVYTSGQVARNSQGEVVGVEDAGAQTRQVLENLKSVLAEAGATLDDIVKVVVYVTDVDDFTAIHKVRAEYFKDDYPASTLVEVSALAGPELLVEIEAIAVIP